MSKSIRITCDVKDYIDIDSLDDFQNNLKSLHERKAKKLRTSIIKHGITFPAFVWKSPDNKFKIIDAHQRIKILKIMIKEGWKLPKNQMPVVFISADSEREAKEKIILAASQYGEVTDASLHDFLNDAHIPIEEIVDMIDIPYVDVDFCIDDNSVADSVGGNNQADEIPDIAKEKPRVKKGEVWKLGNHRLLCGDSTDTKKISKFMLGKKADMIFTSPPYNMNSSLDYNDNQKRFLYKGENRDNRTEEEFLKFNDHIFDSMIEATNKRANIFYNLNYNANSEASYIKIIANAVNKLNLRETIIWKKIGMPSGGYHMTRMWEFVFLFTKHDKAYFQNKTNEERLYNFWEIANINSQHEIHRACFPVELPRYAIDKYCPKKGKVLDLFMGTGTTLIAAEQQNCVCFGVEIEPIYCDIILKRWENATGHKAKRV